MRIFSLDISMHRIVNATYMQLEVGSVHATSVQTITNLDLNGSCEMPTTFFFKKARWQSFFKSDTRDSVMAGIVVGTRQPFMMPCPIADSPWATELEAVTLCRN